jgi:hypothetical protein
LHEAPQFDQSTAQSVAAALNHNCRLQTVFGIFHNEKQVNSEDLFVITSIDVMSTIGSKGHLGTK